MKVLLLVVGVALAMEERLEDTHDAEQPTSDRRRVLPRQTRPYRWIGSVDPSTGLQKLKISEELYRKRSESSLKERSQLEEEVRVHNEQVLKQEEILTKRSKDVNKKILGLNRMLTEAALENLRLRTMDAVTELTALRTIINAARVDKADCDEARAQAQQAFDEVLARSDELQRERDSAQQQMSCVICMDKPRGVMFNPCNHIACCERCSNPLPLCPLCRVPIGKRIKAYLG